MSKSLTFQAEPFALSTNAQAKANCRCPNCRATNEGGSFEEEAFLAAEDLEFELPSAPWSPHLGYGRSVPGATIEEEVRPQRRAHHPTLGPGRVVQKSSVLRETDSELELIGTDDRVRVTGTTAVPFRWMCALDLFFPDPDNPSNLLRFIGSGTLISPRHVLTAGHCLFDNIDGSAGTSALLPVSAITVSPGRNGGVNPLGSTSMQSFQVNATWRASRNARFDYGVITLRDAIGDQPKTALAGQPLGFWGSSARGAGTVIQARTPASLKAQPVNISGYPADKPSGQQWRGLGKIVHTAPSAGAELIYYDIDTCGGHSGSPIWLRSGNSRNLIAIHTGPCILGPDCANAPGATCFPGGQRRTSNRGVRITAAVLSNIAAWTKGGGATSKPILRRGSKGTSVVELQTRLNIWRGRTYNVTLVPLVVDGDFGPKTQAMVLAFQRSKGLTVDGIVGPITWGALAAYS